MLKFWYNHGSYGKNFMASIPYVILSVIITLVVLSILRDNTSDFFNGGRAKPYVYGSWVIFALILPLIMTMFPSIKEN